MKKLIIASLPAMAFLYTSSIVCAQAPVSFDPFSLLTPTESQYQQNTARIFNKGPGVAAYKLVLLEKTGATTTGIWRPRSLRGNIASHSEVPIALSSDQRLLSVGFITMGRTSLEETSYDFDQQASESVIILYDHPIKGSDVAISSNPFAILPPL